MALQMLSPRDLAATPTVFASFMGQPGTGYKTVDELLGIYRKHSPELTADPAGHLRVGRFMRDMTTDRWTDGVVMQVGVFDDTLLLIDGIHRAIAYLGCLQAGVGADRLPPLQIDC